MIKDLLKKEKDSLNHFLDHVDQKALEDFIMMLRECRGYVIFTGIGKSGLIAEKIATTMTSTGSKAFYISPMNALHGDIGIATPNDIVVMLSKSGESDELLHLVPFLRNKGVKVACMINNPKSRLAKAVDHSLVLPFEKELCPFDLAPTISAVTQLIIGDIIAVALMQMNNFSMSEYALNHPSGRIGRRVVTRVKDIMLSGDAVPLTSPDVKLVDVLGELSRKGCGCVFVVDTDKHILGIFTDGDLRRALEKNGAEALNTKIEKLMTRSPKTIDVSDLAYSALQLMEADQKRPITVLAVIDQDKKIVGVVKMHDIVQAGL